MLIGTSLANPVQYFNGCETGSSNKRCMAVSIMTQNYCNDSKSDLIHCVLGSSLSWVVFASGILLTLGIDAIVRLTRKTTASPEEIGSIVPRHGLLDSSIISLVLFIGAISLFILWKATGVIRRRWIRALIILFNIGLGFVLYCIIVLLYAIETGVDSF